MPSFLITGVSHGTSGCERPVIGSPMCYKAGLGAQIRKSTTNHPLGLLQVASQHQLVHAKQCQIMILTGLENHPFPAKRITGELPTK